MEALVRVLNTPSSLGPTEARSTVCPRRPVTSRRLCPGCRWRWSGRSSGCKPSGYGRSHPQSSSGPRPVETTREEQCLHFREWKGSEDSENYIFYVKDKTTLPNLKWNKDTGVFLDVSGRLGSPEKSSNSCWMDMVWKKIYHHQQLCWKQIFDQTKSLLVVNNWWSIYDFVSVHHELMKYQDSWNSNW